VRASFCIPQLPVGVYTVTFEHQGFTKTEFVDVEQVIGRTRTLNATLQVDGSEDRVEVSSASALMDHNTNAVTGKVPQLEFMWISSDHTGGPPEAQAMQADNDLALGRFVDAISHSPIWKDSAIFVEEDDAQAGVDIPGATASISPLTYPGMTPAARVLMAGWMKKKAEIFAGKYQIPDSEDVDTVRHYNWYEATGFKVPFPGEKKVRPASDFKRKAPVGSADDDD
jgi:hypothetical protein